MFSMYTAFAQKIAEIGSNNLCAPDQDETGLDKKWIVDGICFGGGKYKKLRNMSFSP